jgi:Fe2+ or Zn2+ uptake regulation protein
LQEQVAREHEFSMVSHRLEIFGLCAKCGKS